jgi:hypothetical protein
MQKLKRVLMTLGLTLSLVLFAQNAQASCTTHTYFAGGQILTCTTCCPFNGTCTTTCI